MSANKLTVSKKVVIPAPIFIGINSSRNPVIKVVPDFRRDDVWMPDQVRHDRKGPFINTL